MGDLCCVTQLSKTSLPLWSTIKVGEMLLHLLWVHIEKITRIYLTAGDIKKNIVELFRLLDHIK